MGEILETYIIEVGDIYGGFTQVTEENPPSLMFQIAGRSLENIIDSWESKGIPPRPTPHKGNKALLSY